MSAAAGRRHRNAAYAGVVGCTLGVLAGVIQAAAGSHIPDWTGAKTAPGALGLLTIALSLLAGLAAVRQRSASRTAGTRAACALALIAPALLCFTTVGPLWYLPGPLLLVAGILSIDSWKETAIVTKRKWFSCLLSALGVCELLMAAGSPPPLMAVGAVGGIALFAAAWLRTPRRSAALGLVALGTVPFAALAWTALVPVLLLLAAAAVAVPLVQDAGASTRA